MSGPLPQLRMKHLLQSEPAAAELPSGYVLRVASAGDDLGLARVLNLAFPEMMWDAAKVHEILLDHPEVPETYLVEFDGECVATASYQEMGGEFEGAGWVHYVAADPAHAGKGLGYEVTRRVLSEAAARRRSSVFLTTDDPRLAAIRTYVKLGFEPDMWHESHPARWEQVRTQLRS